MNPFPQATKVPCALCEKLVNPIVLNDECLCLHCAAEMRRLHLPQIRQTVQCPRCDLCIDGYAIRLYDNRKCPRCGITLKLNGKGPSQATALTETEKATKAVDDLCLILSNWGNAYLKWLRENQSPDYSVFVDYFQEILHLMCPYMGRLRYEGWLDDVPDATERLRNTLKENLELMLAEIEEQEYFLRFTGRWTDEDQEAKDCFLVSLKRDAGIALIQ